MAIFGSVLVGLATLASCVGAQCADQVTPDAAQEVVETASDSSCNETISWDGRSAVHVMRVSWRNAQRYLDQGNAVNIGTPGHAHVAGHYSTHGSIFRSGPTLNAGDIIHYDCTDYRVTGRGSAATGSYMTWRPGLTVQYSGCGGACLVFAQPI